MGKIAVPLHEACRERERLGSEAGLRSQLLACGDGWSVEDVICTHRPSDRPFEERHGEYRVALVGAGTFQCRGDGGHELMTPGSLLLGNVHDSFECGHEHGSGDRCLAFAYSPDAFERLAHDAGARGNPRLKALRIPALDALAPLVADACAAWTEPKRVALDSWDELGTRVAAAAATLAGDVGRARRGPVNAERGVARAVRLIEADPAATLNLAALAREAHLSRFHFLREFARVTGLTPHRYVMRARLRKAAVLLSTEPVRVIDAAMIGGFRDVSNFNHAFRAEFGTTPRALRERRKRH